MASPGPWVGVDLVYLPDFRAQLGDPASSFLLRTFTPAERRAAELRARRRLPPDAPASELDLAPHLAARFAAKEAFLKAWDQRSWGEEPPLSPAAVDHTEIEVVADAWDRPALRLHGAIAAAFGSELSIALSLTHDGPFASAVVILQELRP